MAPFDSLPLELQGSILHKVATDAGTTPDDLCNSVAVCKSWNEAIKTSCWQAHLDKVVGHHVSCGWEEAAWLSHYLRNVKKEAISASSARALFKLNAAQLAVLKPVRVADKLRSGHGSLVTHFSIADVIDAVVKKHGSIEAFRGYVRGLRARANKKIHERQERQRVIDEALATFGQGVRTFIRLQIQDFVNRNSGPLDGIIRQAVAIKARVDRKAELLAERGLESGDDAAHIHTMGFERGHITEKELVVQLDRTLVLNEALKANGLRVRASRFNCFCRQFVRYGVPNIEAVLREVEIQGFFLGKVHAILYVACDSPRKKRQLAVWMEDLTREEVLKEAPASVQQLGEFVECFAERFGGH